MLRLGLILILSQGSLLGTLQADCSDAILPLGGASGDFSRRQPSSMPPKPLKSPKPKVEERRSRPPDSVEISPVAKALSELQVKATKPSRSQIREAFERRLHEIQTELSDPQLRDGEDIRKLNGDFREAKSAYRLLVEAQLADPHPQMQE